MKRGQIQGQVFIYILTLIITATILLFGYNAIQNIKDTAEQVELVDFKNSLKQDFEKMSSDYGSSETENYNVPSKIKEICFYQKGVSPEIEYPSESVNIGNPLIKNSIDDTDNNVFLIGNALFEPMELSRIEVTEGQIVCIKINNNRLSLILKGLGDGVLVKKA